MLENRQKSIYGYPGCQPELTKPSLLSPSRGSHGKWRKDDEEGQGRILIARDPRLIPMGRAPLLYIAMKS